MTYMEMTCQLQAPLQPEQLRSLANFANNYGLQRFHVDEVHNRLRIEYDASRLTREEVLHILLQAKIPVHCEAGSV